jgi:2-polyprenyl-3-methyl-5-hydroxy-6-metoxy-1,4-benzoquinol methylase
MFGKDLESMSFAVNYHKWILQEFRPFLGKRLVEVGAGTGSFSELLLQENPQTLDLIEPSEMFDHLQQNIPQIETKAAISYHRSFFSQVAQEIADKNEPESIIYVNVMEHIEDDLAELKIVYQTLKPGGRCFIFVPALMFQYGAFDRRIGHFRRYTKSDLHEKCRSAGFKIVKSKYVDLAGIVPWFVKYKILKSDSLGSGAVKLYDKCAVPVVSKMESVLRIPIGKNCLMVAEK